MNPQNYKKQITIVSLNTQQIVPGAGKTFQPFTIYKIGGNDGIIYETSDSKYYSKRIVGESIEVNYQIQTKVGSNERVFSHYRINLPVALPQNNAIVIEGMTKIYARIEQMEKNLLAKLDLVNSEVAGPKDLPIIKEESEKIEEANQTLNKIYDESPEDSETGDSLPEDELPF